MRGHFRIKAPRAPYRRAGLVFEERQREIPAGELDGGRLVTLCRDRTVTVSYWHEGDGAWRPLSGMAAATDAEAAQRLIDAIGAGGAPDPAPRPAEDDDGRLALLSKQLEEARGEATLLARRNAELDEALRETREALARANVDLANARAELEESSREGDELALTCKARDERIAELEAALAARPPSPPASPAPAPPPARGRRGATAS